MSTCGSWRCLWKGVQTSCFCLTHRKRHFSPLSDRLQKPARDLVNVRLLPLLPSPPSLPSCPASASPPPNATNGQHLFFIKLIASVAALRSLAPAPGGGGYEEWTRSPPRRLAQQDRGGGGAARVMLPLLQHLWRRCKRRGAAGTRGGEAA